MGVFSNWLVKKGFPAYVAKFSVWQLAKKMGRKWICQNLAPNCVLLPVRIALYRLCGFKIGKNVFIGMKCYLDDLCVDKCIIEDDVTISYGVYVTQHGPGQAHNHLVFRKGAYVGMRANITARHDLEIGENAIVGASTLVNKSVPAGATCVGIPGKLLNKD